MKNYQKENTECKFQRFPLSVLRERGITGIEGISFSGNKEDTG
jgi:hypothetical protein